MTDLSYVEGVKRQFNLPNYLTIARVFLPLPIIAAIYLQMSALVVMLVLLAAASDWFDGYLARRWGMETPLGRVADPLADKLFVMLTLLPALFIHASLPLLALWSVMVAYDIDNTWQRRAEIGRALLNLPHDRPDLPATWVSKCKTATLFGLLAYCYLPPTFIIADVLQLLAVATLALVLVSWYNNRKAWLLARLGQGS